MNETETQAILAEVDRQLDDLADSIFSNSQENIVKNGAVNEGTLLKSGYVNRAFLEKTVGYSAPYAAHVEYGTQPHMPPVEPLIHWCMQKLKMKEDEAKKTAWAIAKTIEKEGTEAKPFFRQAIEKALRKAGGLQ